MAGGKLTAKQAKFVEEYLVDLNASAAARRAGYSARTANRIASELLSKPDIQQAIQARRQGLARNIITPEEIIQINAKIARIDIKDFLRFGTEKVQVDTDEDGKPVYAYRQVIEAKPSSEVDGTLINEVSISESGTFKFKLYDKQKAVDSLAKTFGMYIDKVEHSGKLEYELVLPEELEEAEEEK